MFKNRKRGQKVILISNLTYINENLVEGTVGYTVGKYGFWSRFSKSFIGVRFPGNIIIDVFYRDLMIIKKDETEEQSSKVNL